MSFREEEAMIHQMAEVKARADFTVELELELELEGELHCVGLVPSSHI